MSRFNTRHSHGNTGPPFAGLRRVAPAVLLLAAIALAGCDSQKLVSPTLSPTASNSAAALSGGNGILSAGEALHLEGSIGRGALWSIDRPADWNGDLVVYLHGYTDPALPVALPAFGPIRDALLQRGYAVVASSYSENGYAAKDGVQRSHQLRGVFASKVGQPERTYLFGQSLGGLVGLLMTQKYPEQYDGSLLVCGIVGGSDDEIQYMGDIRVLFDAVYPGVMPGDLEHPPANPNYGALTGAIATAVTANPQGLGIIQCLARRPLPGANGQELVTSLVTVLLFGVQGGGDLFDRTHGHSFYDNADWQYSCSALPAAMVADINARVARFDAAPDAQAYLAHYGEPAGNLQDPVLALHTSRDPVVPVFHEDLFGQVAAGPQLLQRAVSRYGHCTFTIAELMSNFESLVGWVETGIKPAS